MKKLLLLSMLGLAVASFQALAAAPEAAVQRLDVGNPAMPFEVQRAAIVTALNDGTTYSEMSGEDRRRVQATLDRIAAILRDRPVTALTELDRVELFNQQEVVNALLAGAREDSRMVCTRERKVGTHRATSVCMTVAERRRAREYVQQEVEARRVLPVR